MRSFVVSALRPGIIGVGLIIAVLAVRLVFVLMHSGYWGVDGGAYLLSRNAVLGLEKTGMDFVRPPFAPGWLLVPFTYLLGNDVGLKVWAVAVSFAPLPAVLLLARKFLRGWQIVAALYLVLTDWMLAEMFTAGPLPMVGFGWMLLAAWAVYRLSLGQSWRAIAALIIALPAIAYTNQTSVGISAVFLTAFTVGVMGATRKPLLILRGIAIPVILGIALSLTAWPYYAGIIFGSGVIRYPGPLMILYPPDNAVWWQLVLAIPVAAFSLRDQHPLVKALGLTALTLACLSPLVSYDESLMNVFYRSRYLLMILTSLLTVRLFATKVWPSPVWRPWIIGAGGAYALILAFTWPYQMYVESKLGLMVTADTAQAIDWLKTQPDNGAIVTDSYSLSLYVSALTNRRSPWTQTYDPPPAYAQQHTDATCLMGWVDGCDVEAARTRLNADYLLVETMWPAGAKEVGTKEGLGPVFRVVHALAPVHASDDDVGRIWGAPANPWATTASAPWLTLVWEQGTTKVWEVNHAR